MNKQDSYNICKWLAANSPLLCTEQFKEFKPGTIFTFLQSQDDIFYFQSNYYVNLIEFNLSELKELLSKTVPDTDHRDYPYIISIDLSNQSNISHKLNQLNRFKIGGI